jgi:hypothetical protein
MSKTRGLPIGVVVVVLILALATIGVGYGLWSQTLVINGTVHTGEMDSALSVEEIDQTYDFNDFCPTGGYSIGQDCDGDTFLNDDMEAEGKDVAGCTAALVDEYTMQVTVTNGYPSFNCFIRWNVANTGSIPIHIYRPDYFYAGVYYPNGINTAELHVNGWPPICYLDGTQLEPGEEAYCNLHIHVNQGAAELGTYTFLIKVFTRQWNEIVPPPWRP